MPAQPAASALVAADGHAWPELSVSRRRRSRGGVALSMQSKRATGWSAQRTLSPLTPPTEPLSSGLLDEACTRTPRQRHLMEQLRVSEGGEARETPRDPLGMENGLTAFSS
jgi:hypothetical protein